MTRITRRIALLLSIPLASIGCESTAGPAGKSSVQALTPRSAEDLDARTAAALQASDHANGEMMDAIIERQQRRWDINPLSRHSGKGPGSFFSSRSKRHPQLNLSARVT